MIFIQTIEFICTIFSALLVNVDRNLAAGSGFFSASLTRMGKYRHVRLFI